MKEESLHTYTIKFSFSDPFAEYILLGNDFGTKRKNSVAETKVILHDNDLDLVKIDHKES